MIILPFSNVKIILSRFKQIITLGDILIFLRASFLELLIIIDLS